MRCREVAETQMAFYVATDSLPPRLAGTGVEYMLTVWIAEPSLELSGPNVDGLKTWLMRFAIRR